MLSQPSRSTSTIGFGQLGLNVWWPKLWIVNRELWIGSWSLPVVTFLLTRTKCRACGLPTALYSLAKGRISESWAKHCHGSCLCVYTLLCSFIISYVLCPEQSCSTICNLHLQVALNREWQWGTLDTRYPTQVTVCKMLKEKCAFSVLNHLK